jgi:phospholipid/cholesterol/gamma-HCH transport system substrate-binding protein
MPRRSLSTEFFVGIFTLCGVAAAGYLSIGLGDLKLFGPRQYSVLAEFDNIAGLKTGASVEIAGVQVGQVTAINLNDPAALVTLSLEEGVKLRDDDIASVRTKGIIGDKYIKISRGGSERFIPENGKLTETESAVDIEDIIGKIIHSFESDPEKSAPQGKEDGKK